MGENQPLPTAASGLNVETQLLSSVPSLLLPSLRVQAQSLCPSPFGEWTGPPEAQGLR